MLVLFICLVIGNLIEVNGIGLDYIVYRMSLICTDVDRLELNSVLIYGKIHYLADSGSCGSRYSGSIVISTVSVYAVGSEILRIVVDSARTHINSCGSSAAHVLVRGCNSGGIERGSATIIVNDHLGCMALRYVRDTGMNMSEQPEEIAVILDYGKNILICLTGSLKRIVASVCQMEVTVYKDDLIIVGGLRCRSSVQRSGRSRACC